MFSRADSTRGSGGATRVRVRTSSIDSESAENALLASTVTLRQQTRGGWRGIVAYLRAMLSAEYVTVAAVCLLVGAVADLYWSNIVFMLQSAASLLQAPTHTILLPVCSTVGRLLSGVLSDLLLRRYNVSRATALAVPTALLLCVLPFLIAATPYVFYAASVFVGLSQGALYAVGPTFTSERFGMGTLGRNWGFVLVAVACAELLLNFVSAQLYAAHITGAGSTVCVGVECYRYSYVLCLCLLVPAVLGNLYLIRRSRLHPEEQCNVVRD